MDVDTKHTFLQVATYSKQREHLRCLWYSDVDNPDPGILQSSKVAFGLTSTSILLKSTIEHHIVLASIFKYRQLSFVFKLWLNVNLLYEKF